MVSPGPGAPMAVLAAASVLACSSFSPGPSLAPPEPGGDSLYHEVRSAMGTAVEVYLYASDAHRATELMETAFAEIERVEAALSTYRATSELSRINLRAADSAVTTDPETFELLRRALNWSERTDGAFDVTVAPLVRAWGFFRGEGRYPPAEELAAARSRAGWRHLSLQEADRSVRFLRSGLEIDLGGIGKGWALDAAAEVLRSQGVEAALLGSGGSSYVALGAPPRTEGWRVRIPDPDDPEAVLSTVQLRDRALSTSGSTEKYFDLAGRRYSHIIDPRTGEPAQGVVQVTVTAPTATDSDALSTGLFVLGPERAAALVESVEGAAALLVAEHEGTTAVVRVRWPEGSSPHGT